jgi:NitT/TauT family transport system substrate-binding protein
MKLLGNTVLPPAYRPAEVTQKLPVPFVVNDRCRGKKERRNKRTIFVYSKMRGAITMKIRNKILTGILAGAVVAAAFAGCGKTASSAASAAGTASQTESGSADKNGNDTEITIGYLPITHALAVFEEKELLDREQNGIKISLQKFSSWSDLTDALNAGKIDGASVLIELAMGAKSQGIDLKAVALGHKDGNVIVASDKIKEAKDLKGKKIAIPHTQSSHNILIQDELAKAGLTVDDVEIIQLPPTEMPSSLASGSIDAYCVAETFGAQAVEQGFGHVLDTSEELWKDSECCGLVFHEKAIERIGKEKMDQFIEKYYEAGKNLDRAEAKKIARNYLGQDEKVLDTSLAWIRYDDLKITKEAYETLYEKVKKYNINNNPPAYEDFVYPVSE